LPDFGCRYAGQAAETLRALPDVWYRCADGQRKNQSLTGSIADLRGCYSPLEFRGYIWMGVISTEAAVGIIHECAVLYSKNLSGRNVMFVTECNNHIMFLETLFLPRNFMHLTGVKSNLNSEYFYESTLNQRLSPSSITFDPGGTAIIKLEVLRRLMTIHTSARMVGDYDNSRTLLVTDKFAGTVTFAMGFIYVGGFYVPNTALKMDVRDVTSKATRRKVVAIFVKPKEEALYTQLSYIAKDISIDDLIIFPAIKLKVDAQKINNG
jgi:hypothetical protein